jgi:predicted TIM-barrel fold metal-dependent hydrolase
VDARDFTRSVEVIDAHVHVQPSVAHALELYGYFRMRGPTMTGPAAPPALGTLEQALAMRERTGVRHLNALMWTWSGTYYRDGQHTLPDDPGERAHADRELRARIAGRIRANNEWALDAVRRCDGLSCFIGIDPIVMDEDEMLAEVENGVRRGAKGIKSNFPDAGILANDRRPWPLYDHLERQEIPIQMVTAERAPGSIARPTARMPWPSSRG